MSGARSEDQGSDTNVSWQHFAAASWNYIKDMSMMHWLCLQAAAMVCMTELACKLWNWKCCKNSVCAGVCMLAWYLTVSSAARSAEWLWDVGCNLMV